MIHSLYGLIDVEKGILDIRSDVESRKFVPIHKDLIENVKISRKETGEYIVEGDTLNIRFHMSSFTYKSLSTSLKPEDVEDEYLITKKTWFGKREYKIIKEGWIILKRRSPVRYTFTKLTIIEN